MYRISETNVLYSVNNAGMVHGVLTPFLRSLHV
jgi:hypothetical protein